ncbi:hypothetical protein LCGC14_2527020, partial [marine sediment metagenome]
SVDSKVTGFHGDFFAVDDPIDPREACSEVILKTANDWMSDVVFQRRTTQSSSLTILIMQRLHENDPTAFMMGRAKEALRLAKKLGKKLKLDSVTPNASIPVDASLNIVIIDNDLDFLKLYESQFSNWNKSLPINLHTADNGIDGLLLIGAYKPNLIIVDLDLSQFDIVEMVNTLSENPMTRHCKIMLVSHHDKNDVDAVKKIPVSVIIEEKPVSFARIKRLVEEIDSELKG